MNYNWSVCNTKILNARFEKCLGKSFVKVIIVLEPANTHCWCVRAGMCFCVCVRVGMCMCAGGYVCVRAGMCVCVLLSNQKLLTDLTLVYFSCHSPLDQHLLQPSSELWGRALWRWGPWGAKGCAEKTQPRTGNTNKSGQMPGRQQPIRDRYFLQCFFFCTVSNAQCSIPVHIVCNNPPLELLHDECYGHCAGWKTVACDMCAALRRLRDWELVGVWLILLSFNSVFLPGASQRAACPCL